MLQEQPITSPLSVCGAVQYCEVLGARHVVVRGDSELIVKQIKGINRWAPRQHRGNAGSKFLLWLWLCCARLLLHTHTHHAHLPLLLATS